ncbi:MAG: isoprenyl transferase [Sarcina sp.]
MVKFFGGKKENQTEEIKLDMEKIPKHIAIIMDGNGRWAKERKLPRTMGHRAGMAAIKKVLRRANDLGVEYLTLYAFSTENWKRPADEVNALMKLLVEFLRKEINELHEENVKIKIIGDISKTPDYCQEEIAMAIDKTKNNTGIVLNVAFNYGGRDELMRAMRRAMEDYKEGKISLDEFNESSFENYLDTAGMPDPDVIIRPSGEQRISNYLLWQCAYSEFWYSNINWPDFDGDALEVAIFDYQNRDRRFGGVK